MVEEYPITKRLWDISDEVNHLCNQLDPRAEQTPAKPGDDFRIDPPSPLLLEIRAPNREDMGTTS